MRTKSSIALAHVGALGGVHAVGNPEQAEEAHDVVDAQRAAVAAVLADRFGEQAVAVFAMARRVRRRKGPVLALRGEIVGRRTHAAARHVERPVRPQVAAEAVGGQRQVVIEPDRQVPVARPLLRAPPVAGRSATAGTGRTSRARQRFLRKARVSARTGVLIRRGPFGPQPDVGIRAVQLLVERAVGGERLEQFAFALAERLETRAPAALPVRHSRRNCANASLRKRSLSAPTRSYSTNGDARSASISRATSGDSRSALRAPAALKSSMPSTSR